MGAHQDHAVSARLVGKTWMPLAASWLLMGLELLILSAFIARLPDPALNLAAFGGIIFPLALVVESPIVMLLAASTALCRDWHSYRFVFRAMTMMSVVLTLIHLLMVFSPAYSFVAETLIRAPAEIVEPARLGLILLIPWTWSIAYRRFLQGVLIRFGESGAVGIGTGIRLLALLITLAGGAYLDIAPGAVIAAAALSVGVLAEAAYIHYRARPIVRGTLRYAPAMDPPLTAGEFLAFYTPLALTSICFLTVQPMASAAISRMPNPLESLAVWPALTSLTFMLRSPGLAYNEVVVALADQPGGYRELRRFGTVLSIGITAPLLLLLVTPAGSFWFRQIVGLDPHLVVLATGALWVSLLLPALAVQQSFYQGILVNSRKTRPITESTILFLAAALIVLVWGVWWNMATGAFIALAALSAGHLLQNVWQLWRSRPMRRVLQQTS
jgi:hypothetical protein